MSSKLYRHRKTDKLYSLVQKSLKVKIQFLIKDEWINGCLILKSMTY